jgi:hypothetical protein
MFRPNSGHRQVYNSSAVRVLQYASLRQGVEISSPSATVYVGNYCTGWNLLVVSGARNTTYGVMASRWRLTGATISARLAEIFAPLSVCLSLYRCVCLLSLLFQICYLCCFVCYLCCFVVNCDVLCIVCV